MSLIKMVRTRKRQIGKGWPPYVIDLKRFGDRLHIFEWGNISTDDLPGDTREFDESLEELWESL